MNTTRNAVIGIVIVVLIIVGLLLWNKNSNPEVTDQYTNSSSTQTVAQPSANGSTNTSGGTVAGSNSIINNDAALNTVIGNSLVRIPETGTDVALTQGEGDAGTSSSTRSHVSLGGILAKVQTDQGYDVFVDLTYTKAGSPTKVKYVALFQVVQETVGFKSAVSIANNVELKRVAASQDPAAAAPTDSKTIMSSSKGYILVVSYLDRLNGQPITTAPSLTKTINLRVKEHVLSR